MAKDGIEKRASGGYQAQYRGPDGRRKYKTFAKHADAVRFRREMQGKVDDGTWVNPNDGNIAFEAYATRWLADSPHRGNTTRSNASRLRNHVYPVWHDRPIRTIYHSDVKTLVAQLSKKMAPGTVRVILKNVSAIFSAAVDDRRIPANPCDRVKKPRPPKRLIDPMVVEQVIAMRNAMPPRYEAAVIVAAGSGLRQGELFGLTVDRIKWLEKTIHVNQQMVSGDPEGRHLGELKTESSYRIVPVTQSVLDVLSEHLRVYGPGQGGLVFSTSRGTAVTKGRASDVWRAARQRAGLDHLPGWHELRHHFVSLLIFAGVDVVTVAHLVGHASSTETLRTYGHLYPKKSDDGTRQAVERHLGTALAEPRSVAVAGGAVVPLETSRRRRDRRMTAAGPNQPPVN